MDRINLWQYTEDLASNRYSAQLATKVGDTINVGGIKLAHVNSANYNASIRSQLTSLSLAPFVAGEKYLISYYATGLNSTDQLIYFKQPPVANNYGHGSKLLTNRVRRLWQVIRAVTPSTVTPIMDPTNPSADPGGDLYWFGSGQTDNSRVDVLMGGFMAEHIDPANRDGIAVIGDSTMSGASGGKDTASILSREVPKMLGALLNVNCFNRAIGGYRYDQLDTQWSTQITPIAGVCKYAVIQGGVNDVGQDRTLAQIQPAVLSMAAKAAADGLQAVFFTCTPSAPIGSVPAREAVRQSLNKWLKETFPCVIDIASVVENVENPGYLIDKPGWNGDGTHYGVAAARAIADYAAAWTWDFVKPSPYQPIVADGFL